ncbi:MAG: HD domain-containing protein [Chloroflexi bacterium]|nr:HD domain-containing protein [Chloroflexota bacterium]
MWTVDDPERFAALSGDLECLLRETYRLWDPGWVSFTWRGYTYDHVQRVRRLATHLCVIEGGDARVIELAALLHDITKLFDGEIIIDANGARVVDEAGFWRNHIRRPDRQNKVTALYDRLNLTGKLHSESGAAIARELLRERGFDEASCERVAETIRHHLRPPSNAPLESLCLFDADTIDANIGMPSFIRNIYIHLHMYDVRRSPEAPPVAQVLRETPRDYLEPYITERLPTWAAGKQKDFVPRLRTESGRSIALARLERLEYLFSHLARELTAGEPMDERNCLGAVVHLMSSGEDPSISDETAHLADGWLTTATSEAQWFVQHLLAETRGAE